MAFVMEELLRGTALLVIVFGIGVALRDASAATRHFVWFFGLLGLLALPFLTRTIPWDVDVIPAFGVLEAPVMTAPPEAAAPADREPAVPAPTRESADRGGEATVAGATPVPARLATETSDAEAASGAGADTATRILFAVWLVGALAIVGRIGVGLVTLRRYARRARTLDDPTWTEPMRWARERLLLDTPVRLLASEEVAMPLTAGVTRPLVLVPSAAETWSSERRRAVLLHELAHVKRRDVVPHLLAWLACGLWWFHPLVWGAARRMRAESERACDDLVLKVGTRASSYADHLLDLVCAAGPARAPAPVVPLAQRSEFEGRMIAILDADRRRTGATVVRAALLGLAVALVAIPLAALGVRSVAAPAADPEPATAWTADDGEWAAEGEKKDGKEKDREDAGAAWDAGEESEDDAETGETAAGLDTGDLPPDVAAALTRELGLSDAAGARAAEVEAGAKARPANGRQIAALARTLSDPDPRVRVAVAEALGNVQDPRAIEALSRALRNDPEPAVRKMAAWALGEIEDARGVPALLDALRGDDDPAVRATAAEALGQIESPTAVEGLAAALDDPVVEVRRNAVHALGHIEDPRAVPRLLPLLRHDDVQIRRLTVEALGDIESGQAVDGLIEATRDADPEVRASASEALGNLEEPRAAPALLRAMKDESVIVRRAAVDALGDLDLATVPRELLDAVNDPDREVRMDAVDALGNFDDPAAVPVLLDLIRTSGDRELQYEALEAVADMDGPVPRDVLIPLLEHEDPEIRKRAAEALGRGN